MNASKICDNCSNTIDPKFPYCPYCSQEQAAPNSVNQNNNHGGTNVNAGRDINFGDDERWDTRTKLDMSRAGKRPVWPVDWVSAIAAIITIASFVGASQLPNLFFPLGAIALTAGAFAFAMYTASNDLRTRGAHVLPLGLGTLERGENGTTWLTEPTANCAFCPDHRSGTMHVSRTPNGPQWVCSNSTDHRIGFDGTQLPPLKP